MQMDKIMFIRKKENYNENGDVSKIDPSRLKISYFSKWVNMVLIRGSTMIQPCIFILNGSFCTLFINK